MVETPSPRRAGVAHRARSSPQLAAALAGGRPQLICALLALLVGCEPDLNVGSWTCASDAAVAGAASGPIELPWSTGFEDGFCDYTALGGFCYNEPRASYETVTAPVHSGHYAAAFSVIAGTTNGHQTRCVRQGVLPVEAYYGAWYFVPERATSAVNWNLLHFQGGSIGSSAQQHGTWDVTLESAAGGALEAVVFDFLNSTTRRATSPKPIPIGAWFHLELYLKRASDTTGAVALYQDGQQLLEADNIVTDDTSWGQWYVGNLASGLTPPESTLYVDDVTIRSTR